MSSYAIPHYEEFFQHTEQRVICGGMIENMDGGRMYVAEIVKVEFEEELMTKKPYVHELLHALKISWPFLVLIIGSVYSFFLLTQSRIDAQMAEVRAQMSEDRKSASDDNSALRKSASEDNAALRKDMSQGFNRIADKLDEINKTLTNVQIDQAVQKTKSEQEKP